MKRSIVMLPSLWIKWYSIARLRDVIGIRNATSVIKKKSPWTFGGYTDIYSDWQAPRQSQPFQNSTVGLSNVFWILLWIAGLKLWVICVITFDLVELWPVRTKLRTRGTSISFPPLPLLASSFRHVCHVIEQGLSSYAAIHTIFIFDEVHLAPPFGWKCFHI